MKRFAFAIPGDLALPTGGYAYDRRVLAQCRAAGVQVDHLPLPDDFPHPGAASLAAAESAFASVPEDVPILVDGLAFGALPAAMLRRCGRRFIALVHHPLALETGLSQTERQDFQRSEREALAQACAVITTSAATARMLTGEYAVEASRICVARPGVDPAPRSSGGGVPPRLLAVGALVPRKGYPVLVEALALLKAQSWRCRIIGSPDRDPPETARIAAAIEREGLGARIALAGQVDDTALADAYARADLFILPSFHEGYGMVLSEALGRGLPVISTTAGAIPETVPPAAGLLVRPGDATALADAIAQVLGDLETRRAMSEAAWQAGRRMPGWTDTAAAIVAAMENCGRLDGFAARPLL